MGDTKFTSLSATSGVVATDIIPTVPTGGGLAVKATASQLRQYIGAGLSNASTALVSAGYATDTYLAGSAITIPVAGAWQAGSLYICQFDMTKTALGTAAFTITVRMGTAGTTADSAIAAPAFAVGTAAADTGLFEVLVSFRSVGSGTSAVIQTVTQCTHHLAATGLISTGASGTGIILATSSGFNSTTQTVIGLSVNGGASFSGTNTLVQALAFKV